MSGQLLGPENPSQPCSKHMEMLPAPSPAGMAKLPINRASGHDSVILGTAGRLLVVPPCLILPTANV